MNIGDVIMKKIGVYITVFILSAVILFFGSKWAHDGVTIFKHSTEAVTAKVMTIDKKTETKGDNFTSTVIIFRAQIQGGKHDGEVVKAYQEHNSQVANMRIVRPGDTVIMKNYKIEDLGTDWAVENFKRSNVLYMLIAAFAVLVIIFGRSKGFRTIISLAYTCLAVFLVFIPAVLGGRNIYITSIAICVFIIFMTLLLVNGADKKTLCAALGCVGGVLAAAIITAIMSRVMIFAGYTNEDSYYLTMLPKPVNLKALNFAAIIIGAVGAVMDVAMSLSSSLYEMKEKIPDISFKSLVSSGLAIGRDMMGTMSNTLVLAYIGSSVSCVLLLLTYADSLADVLNREMIAYEILQAIAGSLGILLAIPLTTLVCGVFYLKRRTKHIENEKI